MTMKSNKQLYKKENRKLQGRIKEIKIVMWHCHQRAGEKVRERSKNRTSEDKLANRRLPMTYPISYLTLP